MKSGRGQNLLPVEIVTNVAGMATKCWHCGGNHCLVICKEENLSDGIKAMINLIASRLLEAEGYLDKLTISDLDENVRGVGKGGCVPSQAMKLVPGMVMVGHSEHERASHARERLDVRKAYLD